MEGINPIELPAVYEFVVLGANVSPGVAEVTGFKRPFKWDKKAPKGSSGASTQYQGRDLVTGKIKLKLWEPQHFAQWDAFRAAISPPEGVKEPQALGILHPYVNDLEIYSVVVEDIGQVTPAGKGLYTVEIACLEFRKPKPSGGAPKGAKPANDASSSSSSSGSAEASSVADQQAIEIAILTNIATSP